MLGDVVQAGPIALLVVVGTPILPIGAEAQEWQQIPSSFTNSQGYRITGYTARATGFGCEGSQNFVSIKNPSDKGVSIRRWTRASKQDGGTLCSGGTWYYGSGQPGGSEHDLLIKDGQFYRRR